MRQNMTSRMQTNRTCDRSLSHNFDLHGYLVTSCLMQYRAAFVRRNNVQTARDGLSRGQPSQGKTIACTLAHTYGFLHSTACCRPCCSAGSGLITCLLISPQTYLHMYGKCYVFAIKHRFTSCVVTISLTCLNSCTKGLHCCSIVCY